MKLGKTLAQKNKLGGDVATLTALLKAQNSRPSTQKFDYDASAVLTRLRAKITELIEVKAAIARANAVVQDQIFRLAELKGLAAALKTLDTRHGVFKDDAGYAQTAYDIEFVAQLKKMEVDALVAEVEAGAQLLQDSLDEFNFTQTVALSAE
jgi:uncharacterized membrane protein YccC